MIRIRLDRAILKGMIIIFGFFYTTTIIAQSEAKVMQSQQDTIQSNLIVVTFVCKTCKVKNKFAVSGKEGFTLKEVKFPIERKMKPGTYEMTYWQNKVQQIHLPFTVKTGSANQIKVKE